NALGYDFEYSYSDVYQPNALSYVVSMANVQRLHEANPPVSYFCPIVNGTPALITQRFSLAAPIADAFLQTGLASYNFGGGSFGSGSIWGSKDGDNWDLLVDAPTPATIDSGYPYNGHLPATLLGGNSIWIQTRMQTSGWNIMSQFNRKD